MFDEMHSSKRHADDDFQRDITFRPGQDLRHVNPIQDKGIRGMKIAFTMKKDNRAIRLVLLTSWYPSKVQNESGVGGVGDDIRPQGGYVELHSAEPVPPHARVKSDLPCPVIGEGWCYMHRLYKLADRVRNHFLRYGEDGVWEELERLYNTFYDGSS